MKLVNHLRRFVREDEGQDLIEYALLVGLISLAAVTAIGLAGGQVQAVFNNIVAQLTTAAGGGS